MKGRPAVLLVIIVIAFAALWPALLNGGPFYMADTPSYFRGAASVLFKVLHIKTEWTAEFLRLYQGDAAPAAATASSGPAAAVSTGNDGPVTLSGRSVYYGLLLYLGYLAGSVWIIALAQSLLAATSLVLTVVLIARSRGAEVHPAAMLTIGLVTALGTSLGYFSGYLMPDLFTGLTVLAVSNLLFLSPWQSGSEKLFWSATLAYSLLVHSTNLMLCTAIVLLWIVYATLRKPRANLRPLIGVAACIGIGVLGQLAFGIGVKAETGHPPVRPPFIAMRLIADGPGYSYLQKHCGTEHFIYCQALAHPRLPSDTLLWSADPNVSLFRGLPANGQRASAAQQKRFVAAVVAERPLEVLTTAARNSITQLLSFDLVNFNYSDDNRERFEKTIPPASLSSMKQTRAYGGTMPTALVEAGTPLLAAASILLFVIFLARERAPARQPLRGYCLGILGAIFLNAAICGALSGPKGRYQMRLVWILPVVAGALVSRSAAYRRAVAGSAPVG